MTTKEFLEDIEKSHEVMIDITRRKNADYAGVDDPFKNFHNAEVVGVSLEQGILVRMMDKISRISNLVKQEAQVKDESIEDTLIDLANYSLILKAYLKTK